MWCRICFGNGISRKRWNIGYKLCKECGERLAKGKKHTIVPMHKSNYVVLTNKDDLVGINNKGGLTK